MTAVPLRLPALGLATLATVFTLGAPTPAGAVTKAGASIAFQSAPKGVRAADNVSWDVHGATLTTSAVGKTVTITATAPSRIDCATVVLAMGTAKGLVAVKPATTRCSANQAIRTVKMTRAMVGHELHLRGRSAAGSPTRISVSGTIAFTGSVAKVQATVTRQLTKPTPTTTAKATPKPSSTATATPAATVGQVVGSYQGQPVQVDTANGNVVVLGTGGTAKRWTGPAGELLHASVSGSVVHLWYQANGGLTHWTVDLATGKQATARINDAALLAFDGKAGFWVITGASLAGGTGGTTNPAVQDVAYDWTGAQRFQLPDLYRDHTTGFSPTATFVSEQRQVPRSITVVPMNGATKRTWNLQGTVLSMTPDATGVTVGYFDGATSRTCHLSETASSCPGSWA